MGRTCWWRSRCPMDARYSSPMMHLAEEYPRRSTVSKPHMFGRKTSFLESPEEDPSQSREITCSFRTRILRYPFASMERFTNTMVITRARLGGQPTKLVEWSGRLRSVPLARHSNLLKMLSTAFDLLVTTSMKKQVFTTIGRDFTH